MKERAILYSTPMVLSILGNRKTMTRRTMGLKFVNQAPAEWKPESWDNADDKWTLSLTGKKHIHYAFYKEDSDEVFYALCPYGSIGDILWVRETWREVEQDFGQSRFEYKATEKIDTRTQWRPSIFMPRAACRIRLEITDIRVERIQDISEDDALKEGVSMQESHGNIWTPVNEFERLWHKINGEQSWNANPFVWVISFVKI